MCHCNVWHMQGLAILAGIGYQTEGLVQSIQCVSTLIIIFYSCSIARAEDTAPDTHLHQDAADVPARA